mmetsp:Transcript_3373/g.14171  ORF Transcript_3373/g.14171 Transcript_3373/m.14171 type:complete len:372 (-) Transcript_3373:72-1187(-)
MSDQAPPDLTPEDLARRHALYSQIEAYVRPYLARNPRAKTAVDALFPSQSSDLDEDGGVRFTQTSRVWDHLAFRSFDCVDGGLRAVARVFEKHGYTYRGSLTFQEKKVDAAWFAPPDAPWARDAFGDPLFPRLFVSHLRVADLADEQAKAVIVERVSVKRKDDDDVNATNAVVVAERGGVPWREKKLSLDEYETVSRASEYAAWTLINGHALNHVAVPVHRLFVDGVANQKQTDDAGSPRRRFASLETCLAFLRAPPFSLPLSNAGGGEVKVSPDGGLRQASTVADDVEFEFCSSHGANGDEAEAEAKTKSRRVPASYVEFVDRLPTEDSGGQNGHHVPERLLRDGFETANADAIFESTFQAQRAAGLGAS